MFTAFIPPLGGSAPGRFLVTLCLLGNTLAWSSGARAWGAMGHELAGTLAAPYLSANARAQIDALLKDETLASASTWADRMRGDPDPFWQEEAGPYHYVTVPDGQSYTQVGAPPQGDGYTALQQFRKDLRDPTTPTRRKRLALRFALHIVQDLQQPLHVGNGRDRGGNQIRVAINGETSNLHSVWDRQLFESTGRSKETWLDYFRRGDLLREPNPADSDPLLWIRESAALRETLYPVPTAIDRAYIKQQLPRAEQRLALSAVRTAAWLNATFDGVSEAHGYRDAAPAPTVSDPEEASEVKSAWRRWLERLFR
ncbi:S1/P1 nuclease [Congregibacter litoralis]|uniref:S1/P1 Nuclease n=1 Tax=Congregibacter litoralis KT71 TaxID=314285 RepID=A4A822_9GAMM|nr:S1/P1 nuclease [Congregibacter litoralis]EAQ97817.2 S1/P1 Nuclease [Congregibacter litoralis KT71]